MNGTVMNVVCYERDLLRPWSVSSGLLYEQVRFVQGRRNLFVRYGHGRTGFQTQQYILVLRYMPANADRNRKA